MECTPYLKTIAVIKAYAQKFVKFFETILMYCVSKAIAYFTQHGCEIRAYDFW